MQNILLIKHGALGDLIQATGVMKDIRNHYADAKISLLTSQRYVSLMNTCPFVDHIIIDNRRSFVHLQAYWKLAKSLKKFSFDLVIDLQNSDRTRFYRYWWFKQANWIGRKYDEKEPSSGLSGLVDLLHQHGIKVVFARKPDLTWMIGDIKPLLSQLNIKTPYVALIPGSSAKHPEKRWPFYAQLAQLLLDDGLDVIAVLGPDEQDLIASLPCKILLGLDWLPLATVLKSASYVVGNDTGPSHIASHAGARGVAIFGPSTSAKKAEITHDEFDRIELTHINMMDAQNLYEWLAQRFPA